MSLIRGLSFFGLCFAFVVIALGAWTRLVDAGLGCPDWPGCYGFVVCPTTEAEILIAEQRSVSYTHLRAHETLRYLVCRLLLEKKTSNIAINPRAAAKYLCTTSGIALSISYGN